MASANKFNSFVGDLGTAVNNLNADTFNLALFNTSPNAADTKYNGTAGPPAQLQSTSNAAEIAAGNGYSAGGAAIGSTAYSQSSGTGTMTGNNVVWTATGSVGPLRYVAMYDVTAKTSSTRSVVLWWDYGTSITLNSGDTFTVNLTGGILTLA